MRSPSNSPAGPCRRLGRALAAAALLGLAACPVDSPATDATGRLPSKLVFEPLAQEMGRITWPGVGEVVFRFRNTGAKPISVLDLMASCSCSFSRLRIVQDGATVREGRLPGESIGPLLVVQPGERGELDFRLETRTLGGEVKEKVNYVTIVTDEQGTEHPRVFARAQIDRAFEIQPAQVVFPTMGRKESRSEEAKILVYDFRVQPPYDARLVSAPPGVTAVIAESIEKTRGVIAVQVVAGPGLVGDQVSGDVVLEANLNGRKEIRIPVVVPIGPDVIWKPSLFDFQVVTPETPARSAPLVVRLLDPARSLALGNATIEGEAKERLRVERQEPVDGSEVVLVLVADRGLPEATASGIHGLVRIATGLEDFPELRIPYRAYTRTLPKR